MSTDTSRPPSELIAMLMGRPLVADPFPLYHELRAASPVHREDNGVWYLTRYADCERVLRSLRFRQLHQPGSPAAPGPRRQLISRMFSYDVPPAHTEKRALVAAPFTAAACEALAARTTELAKALVDASVSGDVLDVDQLAAQLPVVVTCEMLGIPEPDREMCVGWVDAMTSTNQPVAVDELEAAADRAALEAIEYFGALLADRADHPRADLLSHLAATAHAPYSTDDLVATVVLLMAAGFETTRYTVAGGLLALAGSPTQLAIARDQVHRLGALTSDAIEELVRHQGPIHGALPRHSPEDEPFGSCIVPAGEAVVVMTAAANRDPACYAEPDVLRLDRRGPRALSFGHGPHYCLGVNVAKLEINAAITAVLRRFTRLDCEQEPVPKGSFNVRGPQGARLRVR